MIDRVCLERGSLLCEMIAQYEHALEVAESQLAHLTLERSIRQFCREHLELHGGNGRLGTLCLEIHELDHHIKNKQRLIARMRELRAEGCETLAARKAATVRPLAGRERYWRALA